MKVAMCDPSLFTGRYDDSLCAAMAAEGVDVALLGRPMRATDAIEPQGYRYEPRFFRRSEALRRHMGEGRAFRLLKAAEYGLFCALGNLTPLAGTDVAHMQWLPLAPADRIMLQRLKGRTALVHTVHNADAYHADAGVQGRGYRDLLDMFDALIVHGGTTRTALERQGVDPKRRPGRRIWRRCRIRFCRACSFSAPSGPIRASTCCWRPACRYGAPGIVSNLCWRASHSWTSPRCSTASTPRALVSG